MGGVQEFKELQEFRSLRLSIRGSGFIIFLLDRIPPFLG
jgi:hypothetical protein